MAPGGGGVKFSERWLREWVDPPVDTRALAEQLTRAGLEVDAVEPAAADGAFSGVVAADVVGCRPHPNADRLKICVVDGGGGEPVEVVCGAPNARAGMRAALARPGARIGGGVKVRRTRIRGAASEGMLCSMRELGIGDDHDGIIDLDDVEARPGADVFTLLGLDDSVIEVSMTPDRGDCLSIAGIARELGALNRLPVRGPGPEPAACAIGDRLPISLEAPEGCARYAGRVVRGIDPCAKTPLWMSERLRRSGVRGISPVVDVTNYVMLELGQPLHAFDLHRLDSGIRVRRAGAGEHLTLLDEREVELRPSTLVIADHRRPVALAGVMGGLDTAVTAATRDVFLESAWFDPADLMGEPRFYKLNTDASHRFERGVDPGLQRAALERATKLLLDVAGGQAGPVVDEAAPSHLPRGSAIRLRAGRIERVLGMALPAGEAADGLRRLGMEVAQVEGGWSVTPPGHRFDIVLEEDLIEEVARLAGYDRVPAVGIEGVVRPGEGRETRVPTGRLRRLLADRGYQEAVTYSFVDPALQSLLDPDVPPIRLANPISSELSVMRTRVWMGLCGALVRNVNRQERRVRLFETGLRFRRAPELRERAGDLERWGDLGRDQVADVDQERFLAAVATGPVHPEQWGGAAREIDFFDVKSDVEALIDLTGRPERFSFAAAAHPALHPEQAAVIRDGDAAVGLIGGLHPRVRRELRLPAPAFVFEITLSALASARLPAYAPVSRFPSTRRDVAVTVAEAVPAGRIFEAIRQNSSNLLKDLTVFDVYRGEGIGPDRKSVAIGLTFRADSRTLDDPEVDRLIERIVEGLETGLGAELRR